MFWVQGESWKGKRDKEKARKEKEKREAGARRGSRRDKETSNTKYLRPKRAEQAPFGRTRGKRRTRASTSKHKAQKPKRASRWPQLPPPLPLPLHPLPLHTHNVRRNKLLGGERSGRVECARQHSGDLAPRKEGEGEAGEGARRRGRVAEEAGKEVGRGTQLHSWSAHFLCCLASPRPRLLPPSLPQSGDLCTCARKRLLRPRNSGRRMFLPSRRPSGDSMNKNRRHAHARTLKILTRCVVAGHSPLQVTAPTSLPRSQRERERGEGGACAPCKR